jgi:hypothetical protein
MFFGYLQIFGTRKVKNKYSEVPFNMSNLS